MWPIVTSAFKYGALVLSMSGASNSIEAVQNIYYGLSGDGKSFAINAVRDIFFGKSEIYNTVESVLTLTTGAYLPIAQTKSIVQGLWQFCLGVCRRVSNWASSLPRYKASRRERRNRTTDEPIRELSGWI